MLRISRGLLIQRRRQQWGYGLFGLAIALCVIDVIRRGEVRFNGQGISLFGQFLRGAIQPDLSLDFLQLTGTATLTTFAYAVCGTGLSLSLGFVGGLCSARIIWETLGTRAQGVAWRGIRFLLAVPRSIHEVIWGLLLINLWGLDPLVALVAIAIPFGAIVAKIFAEILDDTPRQGFNALLHAGVNPLQALLYGIFPQALFNLVSYSFYRFECSLRSAAVLGIIGAGGLGYEIYLSLQSLRYEQLWTLFYALILLNGAVDWLSGLLRQKLGCTSRLDLNAHKYQVGFQRRRWLLGTALGSIGLVIWGFWYIQPDWQRLWSPRSTAFLNDWWQQLPKLTLDLPQLKMLTALSLQTLEMSILAIALAGCGGLIVAFCAAKQPGILQQSPIVRGLSHGGLLLCRSIPAPIWALVVVFLMFPGIVPGAIALGIHNLGILGRLMTEVIENVEAAPIHALKNSGSPAPSLLLYGTLPLTLPNFIAYTFYRWEVCLRETVIVGLVGAGGLGRLLTEQLSSFDSAGVTVTLICFLALTYGVDSFSHWLRRTT